MGGTADQSGEWWNGGGPEWWNGGPARWNGGPKWASSATSNDEQTIEHGAAMRALPTLLSHPNVAINGALRPRHGGVIDPLVKLADELELRRERKSLGSQIN